MTAMDDQVRAVVEAGRLGHLVTINADGSPQVSIVWVGVDDDEIVVAHLGQGMKIRNVQRDPRVAISIEAEGQTHGLDNYLIVHGTARLVAGGAPELLQRLAHRYIGPGVRFPPMDNPPPGHVMRIHVDRVGGHGPWAP